MIPIPAGEFLMGEQDLEEREWNEIPVHTVKITRPFFMAATPITNLQYEQFDPTHRKYRGKKSLSLHDDDAAIFISWEDAIAFCKWLSLKEGKIYRLPTEAEWEYACRAGTKTIYSFGSNYIDEYDRIHMDGTDWNKIPDIDPNDSTAVERNIFHDLTRVSQNPPNPWGLYDMHGVVEQWCSDWYGSYSAETQIDPIGPDKGLWRVSRGGSHHTDPHHLRSASRFAAFPQDKHWMLGFRVVGGEAPHSKPMILNDIPLCMQNINQHSFNWTQHTINKPVWNPPIPYIQFLNKPLTGPYFPHNHCPTITWCDNGDLLAIWFSTIREMGREMLILGSRLRVGQKAWEPASVFYHCPGRNMTGSSLWNDGSGRIYHFNGIEASSSWSNLAMTLRISNDNGATWSILQFISPEHRYRNQVISCTLKTRSGCIIQCCDAAPGSEGGTAIHISQDNGKTWVDPGFGKPSPNFKKGEIGTQIAGIHANMVDLKDGSYLAFGRGNDIDEKMPASRSKDGGKTWEYQPSIFSPISGGQRLVLLRLREGPLLFISFTDSSKFLGKNQFSGKGAQGMIFHTPEGQEFIGFGLFTAVSFDEGKTWPVQRLMTDGQTRKLNQDRHPWEFIMDATHAEPRGYMAATQSPDNMIHLLSSGLYYCFNLNWILEVQKK